jgi:3-methyladenine DNA glycosylase Mpg
MKRTVYRMKVNKQIKMKKKKHYKLRLRRAPERLTKIMNLICQSSRSRLVRKVKIEKTKRPEVQILPTPRIQVKNHQSQKTKGEKKTWMFYLAMQIVFAFQSLKKRVKAGRKTNKLSDYLSKGLK